MLDLSPVTRSDGFPSRAELVARYAERSGRDVDALAWYEVLALWKAAVFCEGLYGRYPARRDRRSAWTAASARASRACCERRRSAHERA